MIEPTVLLEIHEGVATITLNRPQVLNSLTVELLDELGVALHRCQGDQVRAVVLTGAGRGFCAGADVKEFARVLAQHGPKAMQDLVNQTAQQLHSQAVVLIRHLPKPVVGAINGAAAGGGAWPSLGLRPAHRR